MARLAAVLVLALALAASATAAPAAPCQAVDETAGSSTNGCIRCSADNTRCELCTDSWVLTAEGQCARCNATHINGWQESCASCRADDPTVCLKCNNYCNSRGCTGYFVTREGHCSHCPEGAAACSDLTGEVRECRSGLGLVGGECRPCKVDGCQKCDGDLWTCTHCIIPRGYSQDGFFPDPATGACERCDKGCKECTGPGGCLRCTWTVLDPNTKACPPCNVANCRGCPTSLDQCSDCVQGFRLDEDSNACMPCEVANCAVCDNSTTCRTCMPGYGLANPQPVEGYDYKAATACHACTKADPNCLGCDGDPAVCSECAAGMAPDPGTGLCVPCRQANASTHEYCSETDATRCGGGTDCAAGFYCHNVTGQCTPCPQAGCLSCGDVAAPTPGNCSECLPGYWDASRPINERRARTSPVTESGRQYDAFQDVPTECKPCSDTNCLICDTSWGAACERCADGYFLDSATKLCRACSEPDGAKYETCAPAPAPAPAQAPA